MKRKKSLAIIAMSVVALSACSSESAEGASEDTTTVAATTDESAKAPTAKAALSGTDSEIKMTGEAVYSQDVDGKVTANISVANAEEGAHGIHIHADGSCEDAGKAAGGHWSLEEDSDHGEPNAEESHIGDMGNIVVDAEGNGTLEISLDAWTLGDGAETDVVGHAIIFHADEDDFGQPTGNAGDRHGCGVIELVES